MTTFTRWFLLVASIALLGSVASAQNTGGSISGVVRDSSGAIIPNATVSAINAATQVTNTTRTNGAGAYSFPILPVGTYEIDARQNGFKEYRQTGIVVDVNSALHVDVALQLGTVAQEVAVSSTAVHVETSNATLGDVITTEKILTQPLATRSFIDLMGLQAGVNSTSTTTSPDVSVSGNLDPGQISVNGQRQDANGFTVNGGQVTENEAGGTSVIPDLDAISQFRIITNSGDAEYGHYNGGTIQVVTKSGTNQFHGDGFEFFRNQDMDANDWFNNHNGTPRGSYQQNQFGGTFGGPIKRDRMFFFGDYQGSRFTTGVVETTIVPNAAELSGDLTDRAGNLTGSVSSATLAAQLSNQFGYAVTQGEAYYVPGCNSSANCVFPNAQIPSSAWAAPVSHLLQYLPAPTPGVTLGGFPAWTSSAANQVVHDNKGSGRVDANSGIGSLSFYYFFDQASNLNPYGNGSVPGFDTNTPSRTQQANFSDTKTIGLNKVNQVVLNFTRAFTINNQPIGGIGPKFSSLGWPEGPSTEGLVAAIPGLEGVPDVNTNEWDFGTASGGRVFAENTFELGDNFSIIKGTHQIKLGGQGDYVQLNERNDIDMNGSFGFDGTETGDDYADFLIGAVDTFTQASQQFLNSRAWYHGWYLQDTWRVKPNFTLDYGLRWEVSTFWYDTKNEIQALVPGLNSSVFPGAPTGWVFPGDPGVPRTLAPTRYNNFAPRFGFAYSPNVSGPLEFLTGPAGHFVVRGGWGVFFTDISDGTLFTELADAPFGLYWQTNGDFFATPWVATNGLNYGQHFPFTPPPPGDTNINWSFFEPISSSPGVYTGNRLPYTEEYNLTFQRQFGSNTLAQVAYVGSQSHRLMAALEANPGNPQLCLELTDPANLAPGQTPCGPNLENLVYQTSATGMFGGQAIYGTRSPFGVNFGAGDQWYIDNANSTYNSLQLTLRHTSGRYSYLAAYTYAKTLGNSSAYGGALDPYNYHATKSLTSFDQPQNFVVSFRVVLPTDKLVDHPSRLLDGWSVSGTTRFAEGFPIGRMSESGDQSLIGTFGIERPNFLGGNLTHLNPRTSTNMDWIASPKADFSKAALGTIGSSPNYFIIGPGFNNTDLTLEKDIKVAGESKMIQARFDAFNVFNHAQFMNPSGNFSSGSFMAITTARPQRIAQVAVKFVF